MNEHRPPCNAGSVCGEAAHCPPLTAWATTPRRVEYTGPEGWTVWGDEDGVHVRTPKGDALEHGDLDRLRTLIAEVEDQFATGHIPRPAPPSAETRSQMYREQREEYDAKRASRAVLRALSPSTTTTPF